MKFTVERDEDEIIVLFHDVPTTWDENDEWTIELTKEEAKQLGEEMLRVALDRSGKRTK